MNVGRLRAEQGSAMIEFALSLTVLLTLLFGIIDVGRALYAYDWVYNAARQTTRWAMVRGNPCNSLLPGCTIPPGGSQARPTKYDIENYVKDMPVSPYTDGLDTTGIDPSAITVTSKCFASDAAPNDPPCAPTAYVQVQVKYTFHFITPFLAQWTWTNGMISTSRRVTQGSPSSEAPP